MLNGNPYERNIQEMKMDGERLFDIHCHIIPNVDDGAANPTEMKKMLQMEYAQGVRNIIATPHFRFGMFETSLEQIKEQFLLWRVHDMYLLNFQRAQRLITYERDYILFFPMDLSQ